MTTYDAFAREQLPRLVRYATMLTGERDLAADLVQDVLVNAYRNWSRIERADRPDRYVLRMVTNQFLSWRTSWAARHLVTVRDVPDRPDDRGDHGTTLAVRDELWRKLATLPRRQRTVLVLRYYEQFTDAEIADLLGCGAGTVRGYAHRGLAALRADLSTPTLADSSQEK